MSYFAWVKQPFREKLVPQIIHDEKMVEYGQTKIIVAKHPYNGEAFDALIKLYPAPDH